MEDLESLFSDDGEFTVGPIVPTEEIIYDTSTGEADEKENKHEPDLLHPSPDPDGPPAEEMSGGKPSDLLIEFIVKEDIEPDLEE